MARDSARSVFTKRRSASCARRPGSAAFGACRWTIRLIICTKRNPKKGERAGRGLLERSHLRVPALEVRLHRDDAPLLLFVVVEIPTGAVREGEAGPAAGQRHRSPLGRRAPGGDNGAVAVDRQVEDLVWSAGELDLAPPLPFDHVDVRDRLARHARGAQEQARGKQQCPDASEEQGCGHTTSLPCGGRGESRAYAALQLCRAPVPCGGGRC